MNVGYVGGSITQLAVKGYHTVGGNSLWPAMRGYGGGTVNKWVDPDTYPTYWALFDEQQRLRPAQVVWWQLAMHTRDMGLVPKGLHAAALDVLQLIHAHCPGAVVEAAPFAFYADATCRSVTPATHAAVQAVTAQLVAEGHVAPGPVMPPLHTGDVNTRGCHQNLTGRTLHGRALLARYR